MERQMHVVIEENGRDGFEFYRVPGIVTAEEGTLLLTYEGREENGNRRTLFLRRLSKDLLLKERIVMVQPSGEELLHNPLLIAGTGDRIYFFWCQDYGRLFLRESQDGGRTFGNVRELTDVVEGFRAYWPVTLWSIAPGHGICKKDGTLVLPLWLSRGENAHLPACFACIYSEDGGETWNCSNVVPAGYGIGDPTETSVAECSDGMLLATMRHEIPGVRCRAFCKSVDSREWEHAFEPQETGSSRIVWGTPWLNQELPDPVCFGALYSRGDGRMAFVNCAYGDEPVLKRQRQGENIRWSLDARQQLTVRSSQDDGNTWNQGCLLAQEGGASDLAGAGEDLYCFYEEGWANGNCIFNRRLSLAVLPAFFKAGGRKVYDSRQK